jgi:hypothetical protein
MRIETPKRESPYSRSYCSDKRSGIPIPPHSFPLNEEKYACLKTPPNSGYKVPPRGRTNGRRCLNLVVSGEKNADSLYAF